MVRSLSAGPRPHRPSAALPREKDSYCFTLMVVVAVTVLSTLAMLIYPLIAKLLHLPPELAGLFIGGTVHDVAQVVVAGYTIDQQTGDYATIVKLFRVSMLAVVVVVVSAVFKRQREAACESLTNAASRRWCRGFCGCLSAWSRSTRWAGCPGVYSTRSATSRACLVLAIAALGVKTSFKELAKAGWRPFTLLLVETLWMALFVLVAIELRDHHIF